MKRPFTDEDIEFLTAAVQTLTIGEASQKMGRTPGSIQKKALRLGLKWNKRKVRTDHSRRAWTPEEDKTLRNSAQRGSARLCAKTLKRTEGSVFQRAYVLGISFYDEERLPLKAIAAILGVSVATVESRRAKLKLNFRKLARTSGASSLTRTATDHEIYLLAKDLLENSSPFGPMTVTASHLKQVMFEHYDEEVARAAELRATRLRGKQNGML